MILSRATGADAKCIHDIDTVSFEHCWSEKELSETLKSQHSRYYIATIDGVAVGYIGYYVNGDILNIAVLPKFRHLGVASSLLEYAIEKAAQNGIDSLILEVRESNNAAIGLYAKHGFNKISERKKYYIDGENALIYMRTLR